MKKYIIPAIISAIVILVIGLFMFAPKANDYSSKNLSPAKDQPSNQQTTANSDTEATAPGVYTDYSEEAFASAQGTRILFFHAAWCPQCKALDASIKAGAVPTNTTILKVDYDSSQDLRRKYGVTTQTTLVLVDSNGDLVKRYIAYSTPSLDALIANLL